MKRMSLWLLVLFCLQLEDEIFMIIRKCFLFLLWFSCLDFDCGTHRQIDQNEETRGNVFFQDIANTRSKLQNGEYAKKTKDAESAAYLQSNR